MKNKNITFGHRLFLAKNRLKIRISHCRHGLMPFKEVIIGIFKDIIDPYYFL